MGVGDERRIHSVSVNSDKQRFEMTSVENHVRATRAYSTVKQFGMDIERERREAMIGGCSRDNIAIEAAREVQRSCWHSGEHYM